MKVLGVYIYNEDPFFKSKLKIKKGGKVIEYYNHFELDQKVLKGKWCLSGDTIFINWESKLVESEKYLIKDSCLFSIVSNKCIYNKKRCRWKRRW